MQTSAADSCNGLARERASSFAKKLNTATPGSRFCWKPRPASSHRRVSARLVHRRCLGVTVERGMGGREELHRLADLHIC